MNDIHVRTRASMSRMIAEGSDDAAICRALSLRANDVRSYRQRMTSRPTAGYGAIKLKLI